LFVADTGNHRIRMISKEGSVVTIAGSGCGYADGPATSSKFYNPSGIVLDSFNNIYISDEGNHRIRKISQGYVSTIAGTGVSGKVDGESKLAQFYSPLGITIDESGNLYVCDSSNYRIRKIDRSGLVSTLAGSTRGYCDGKGVEAKFSFVCDISFNVGGFLVVADRDNHKIRQVTLQGEVTTIAGGVEGNHDGMGTNAQFRSPEGVASAASGNLYVADYKNNAIRKITPTVFNPKIDRS